MDVRMFKERFDRELSRYLEKRIRRVENLLKDKELVSYLLAMKEVALRGGKRARPFMMTSVYEAFGGKDKKLAIDVGIGIELFHLFCLVHDDIIDHGKTRHGVLTVHEHALKKFGKKKRRGDVRHLAEGQAMLIGDFLFSWATGIITDALRERKERPRVLEIYFQMIDDVISGQMIDVDLMSKNLPTESEIRRKMELKTATYSFVRPLQIGLTLAGGEKKYESALRKFGLEIGFAFQLQDDLFDLTADPKVTGKPRMTDVKEGQYTLLVHHFLTHAKPAQRKQFLRYFGDGRITAGQCEEIFAMMSAAGTIRFGNEELERSFQRSEQIVAKARLDEKMQYVLRGLLIYIKDRKK